jgi:4-alpha-glucanotransferase
LLSYDELLNELSELCGIVPEYCDIFGNRHAAPPETKTAILKAMGINTETAGSLYSEIRKKRLRQWNRIIDPTMVFLVTEQPLDILVHVPVKEGDEQNIQVKFALIDENSRSELFSFGFDNIEIIERRTIDEIPHLKISAQIRAEKEIGYYDLDMLYTSSNFGLTAHSRLIITPDACYIPDRMAAMQIDESGRPHLLEKSKTWGLCINLYSLTSGKSWGIGDFGDLHELGEWLASLGAGFIGINPLHSLPNKPPFGISPYSPLSRLYKNPVYLEMETIPEVIISNEAQAIINWAGFQKVLKDLRASPAIDYEKVASLKDQVLSRAFEYFYDNHYLKETPRAADFRRYAAAEGDLLEDFSLFSALQHHMETEGNSIAWRDWPLEYRNRDSALAQQFKKSNIKNLLFYKYVQWLIDRQHGEIFERLMQLGMPIGLYHDLAVGSSANGFDAWAARAIMAEGIDVGAPPDDFNPTGQNWGFPPVAPEKMRNSGYEFLIQTIRKNMRHAGALRIDHALGMFRLFWIPAGMKPEHGAYVKYPSEEILRIIALESERSRAIVIAEDLGTVGEDVRETLFRFRMLSYKLLYFEKNYPDPSFKIPARYSDLALCAVTTHDLPTLYGYWEGQDIEAKTWLGLYPGDEFRQRQINDRQRDKILLLRALKSEGLLPETFPDDPAENKEMISTLCLTIYEFLSRTPSRLLAVYLDDIIGTKDQQNMPGTIDAYPNWVQKTPVPLEKIMTSRTFAALAKLLRKNHR